MDICRAVSWWIGFMLLTTFGTSQSEYVKSDFVSPVEGRIRLSGTFGELRSNHFHSGIDIKPSRGVKGDPVYAIGPGQVVRISVGPAGFGNALYIQHPNGYTSVYAHLDRFIPEIAEYVKNEQYRLKRFQVNLYPDKKFPVEKKELIAYMGNSGSSLSAHLHFEIRKTGNSKPINPLLFGLPFVDNQPPSPLELITYEVDSMGNVSDQMVIPIQTASTDTIDVPYEWVGLGVHALDFMNNGSNKNGIYSMTLLKQDSILYHVQFDDFHFNETRFLNAHTDYSYYRLQGKMVHRLFNLPGNQFSLCEPGEQVGFFRLSTTEAMPIVISIKDIAGNASTISCYLRAVSKNTTRSTAEGKILHFSKTNTISCPGFELVIPKGALYQNSTYQLLINQENSAGLHAPIYMLSEKPTPLHTYCPLSILPDSIPARFESKAFIAQCSDDGDIVNYGGSWVNGRLSTKVRSLGHYTVMLDTVAPKIQPVAFKKDLRNRSLMSFKVTDNFPTGGRAKSLRYEATVDGKWILMEYDAKNDLLTHHFDERVPPGEHELRLTVRDDRGNTSQYIRPFIK